MKCFLVLFACIAFCHARAFTNETNTQLVPTVNFESSQDMEIYTEGTAFLYGGGVLLVVKKRENDVLEFKGKWKWLTTVGDTQGEYQASLDFDQLKINTHFNLKQKFVYTVNLNLKTVNAILRGNTNGLQTYEVSAGSSNLSLKVFGDTKGVMTNYRVQSEIPFELADIDGKLIGIIKTNQHLTEVDGTIWIGPIGMQVDTDNKGKFVCSGHLNLFDILMATARVNTNNGLMELLLRLRYTLGDMVMINASGDLNTNGDYDLDAEFIISQNLRLIVTVDKKGNISSEIKFNEDGYGFHIKTSSNIHSLNFLDNKKNSVPYPNPKLI